MVFISYEQLNIVFTYLIVNNESSSVLEDIINIQIKYNFNTMVLLANLSFEFCFLAKLYWMF